MPKLSEEPLKRYHFMVSREQFEWLERNIEKGQKSAFFRDIIRRLQGQKVLKPQLSVMEILSREELSL